jgi:hypothetical protein
MGVMGLFYPIGQQQYRQRDVGLVGLFYSIGQQQCRRRDVGLMGLFYSQQQCRQRDMGVLGLPYPIVKYPNLGHSSSVADLGRVVGQRVAGEEVPGMLTSRPCNRLMHPPTYTDLTWL